MQNCLFAYGTLRPQQAPRGVRHLIKDLRPLGAGWTRGRLYDLGDYPGAIFDLSAETRIEGDVFALPDDAKELLARLDAYEGFSPGDPSHSLFVRVRLPVMMAGGCEATCWAYRYNRDVGHAPLVAGGDYARRRT